MRIDTEMERRVIDVDGKEYPIAEKTIAVIEKLNDIEHENKDKPAYRLAMAELEVLLGKAACRELFPNGKNENVDRILIIWAAVAEQFDKTFRQICAKPREARAEAVATALSPLNELLRNLNKYDTGAAEKANIREIRRE